MDIPQLVAGYRIGERLGSGSFAVVYKALSLGPGANGVRETVAIKCIDRRSTIATRMSSDNVIREIEILKRMKHRHIVQLLGFQWDKSYIYLVMEFCGGGSLSSFIQLHQCLPERIARKFFRQLASAIHYFREFNIAHMDLKPQNILLTNRHRPVLKVADFGLSQHLRDSGKTGRSFRGSPLYMAPEIFKNERYDARVDLWSCGVILYECLYGRPPFACKTMEQLVPMITSNDPILLPNNVILSNNCVDLLKKLLVRNPENRMSFEDFFGHAFVDLIHAPSEVSADQARNLILDAERAERDGETVNAVTKYAEAIDCLLASLQVIEDDFERQKIRDKISRYLQRAEVLKQQLRPTKSLSPNSKSISVSRENSQLSENGSQFGEDFLQLWTDVPQVAACQLVMAKAQELEREEKWTEAFEKYKLAIDAPLKILASEPNSHRKELLRKKVEFWLGRAEQLKTYISVINLNLSKVEEREQAEMAIEIDTEKLADQHQCSIQ